MQLALRNLNLTVDFTKRTVTSLRLAGKERLGAPSPLFRIQLLDRAGAATQCSAYDAAACRETADGATYTDFVAVPGLKVQVHLTNENGEAAWRIDVTPGDTDHLVEWVDFPLVTLPTLTENDPENGGSILFPYNEGALVSNIELRENSHLRHMEPRYPSEGCFPVFPNMVCTQMLGYIWHDVGLYLGAHDPARGVKGIDFFPTHGGVTMQMRLFCGVTYGETYRQGYPIVWAAVDGSWESAAERYRSWFAENLPPRVYKIADNPNLPEWYEDSPLIISYPVRGIHDMDTMTPNKLFPYTNALPLIDELREATDSRLLVLLMHWEGTAPWAPPYVWPPFGGEENFNTFMEALHEKGDLLGVYCSGFGYTIQSNLVAAYNNQKAYDENGLEAGMCAGPDGKVAISHICTGQRSGYDICPASEVGHQLLLDAYTPLIKSGVDYAQILDQNHGGGQYFCYSGNHGHPEAPGPWMTTNMQTLLGEWNDIGGKMLFGCESAAAEPFIGNLLFSDNRFELNYFIGKAVPMYAYIYHEYLRNFMGNQVSCPFRSDVDSLRWRMAYSFAAGDCMTLVLTPDGILMPNWGTRDFEHAPDKAKTLAMVRNLTKFYQEQAKPYLFCGRMIPAKPVDCDTITYEVSGRMRSFPAIHTTAWETPDGKKAQIFVNPGDEAITCRIDGTTITVPAMNAVLCPLN